MPKLKLKFRSRKSTAETGSRRLNSIRQLREIQALAFVTGREPLSA